MVGINARRAVVLGLVLVSPLAVSCKHERTDAAASNTQASSKPAASARTASEPSAPPTPAPKPRGLPSFVRLGVIPGQGMGPIRLGANVATLERLMQQPCEEKTETLCRFISKGVDYELEDGVTQAIQLHRPGRQVAGPGEHTPPVYGLMNVIIPPNVAMGMLPKWVEKELGKPKKIEKVADGGVNKTVERYYYDGLVLDFDINPENGTEILGGIRIVKSAK
jgi:hypothetical protein